MTPSEPVRFEARDHIQVLWLAHGANALDDALIGALHQAFDALATQGGPAVVVASQHPTVFCPGLDLRRLDGMPRDEFRPFLGRYNALLRRLVTYPGPSVAAVAGHAVAGGSLVALACDRRVMARSGARLGLSEINIGIPLPAGSIAMLVALYPTRSVEQLVLDGDGFGGERALEIGFVEKLADSGAVLDEACRLAHRLATRPPSAYAASKQFLRHGLSSTMEARDEEELELFLDHWYSPETQDRIGGLVSEMRRR